MSDVKSSVVQAEWWKVWRNGLVSYYYFSCSYSTTTGGFDFATQYPLWFWDSL